MSLQHWAIEAAWRNKNDRTVPGTSRYIIHELENNLAVARDGVQSFNLLLDSCANCLNSIVDLLNNDEPNVLSKLELLTETQKFPEWEESVSQTSSWSRSSHQSSESIKMELNLNRSERKVLNSELSTRENLHPLDTKPESGSAAHQPENPPQVLDTAIVENANAQPGHSTPGTPHSSPRSSSKTPVIDFNTSVPQKDTESLTVPFSASPSSKSVPELKSTSVAKSFRFQSSPKVENTKVASSSARLLGRLPEGETNTAKEPFSTENLFTKARTEDSSETGLSPIHVQPRRTVLSTSPNAHPLYVPLKETNAKPTPQAGANGSHAHKADAPGSESGGDDSFQAISTAIRKSFAGNASMAYNASNASIFRQERETTASISLNHQDSRTVKIEPTRQSIIQNPRSKSDSRRTMDTSKRTSIFVSLPDREPIDYRNSIKVKLEAADDLLKLDVSKEGQRGASRDELPKKTEQQSSKKPQDRNGSSATQLKQIFSQIGNSTLTSKPKLVLEPRSPARNGLVPANKQKNRTATNGSPRRLEPPVVKPTNLFGLAKPQVSKRASPDKLRSSPAKKSARSPVLPANRPVARNTGGSPQRLPTLQAGARADARAERAHAKNAVIKNKFLVTKLNPKNPPTFVPSKHLEPRISPKTLPSRSTFGYVPDLQRSPTERAKGLALRKSEFNSIAMLNGKLDLTASENVDSKHTEPANRSPKKTPKSKISLAAVSSNLSKVVPRRRPVGNAVPLPDAARGNFVRDRDRDRAKETAKTPLRRFGIKTENGRDMPSPLLTNDGLPDIPSDDEELRNKKYLKSWAETPEIIRTLNENPVQDPKQIFGDFPVLKMSEVFSSVSPSRSLDTP